MVRQQPGKVGQGQRAVDRHVVVAQMHPRAARVPVGIGGDVGVERQPATQLRAQLGRQLRAGQRVLRLVDEDHELRLAVVRLAPEPEIPFRIGDILFLELGDHRLRVADGVLGPAGHQVTVLQFRGSRVLIESPAQARHMFLREEAAGIGSLGRRAFGVIHDPVLVPVQPDVSKARLGRHELGSRVKAPFAAAIGARQALVVFMRRERREIVGDLEAPADRPHADWQTDQHPFAVPVPDRAGHGPAPRAAMQRDQGDIASCTGLGRVAVPKLHAAAGAVHLSARAEPEELDEVRQWRRDGRFGPDAADRCGRGPDTPFLLDQLLENRGRHLAGHLLARSGNARDVGGLPALAQLEQQEVAALGYLAHVELLDNRRQRHAGREPHVQDILALGIKGVARLELGAGRSLPDEHESLRGDLARRGETRPAHPVAARAPPLEQRRCHIAGPRRCSKRPRPDRRQPQRDKLVGDLGPLVRGGHLQGRILRAAVVRRFLQRIRDRLPLRQPGHERQRAVLDLERHSPSVRPEQCQPARRKRRRVQRVAHQFRPPVAEAMIGQNDPTIRRHGSTSVGIPFRGDHRGNEELAQEDRRPADPHPWY